MAISRSEVTEHLVAEDLVATARLAARGRARFGSGGGQVDELLRRLDRQGPQQNLIEEREDRRVRADSKGK